MVNRKTVSALTIAALLSCAVPIKSAASGLFAPVLGQTTFSVPASVAKGTEVSISSSSDNMNAISDALGKGFEQQYENTTVAIENKDANGAIQDVLNGNADLAAISRPLTDEEKAKGLIQTAVSRSKIAIVVDESNPFAQSITGEQFAKIFRGEIKNWSEVGGTDSEIKLVDRPENSETRQALAPYPVFQTAEFKSAANATTLEEDTSAAVAKELGANGIGYVLVDELESNPSLKPLNLHQTPPTEAAYPFSQPYSFVYAGGASPAVSAFLGYATGNPGQSVVNAAGVSGIGVIPNATATGDSVGGSAESPDTTAGAEAGSETDGETVDPTAEGTDGTETDANGAALETSAAGPDGVLGTADDIEGIDPAGPDGVLGTADDIEVLSDTAGPDGVLGTADDIEVSGDADAGGLGNLAGRGQWWWLLLPLVGLGLLIWAAGKRGGEEETGYSANTGRDSIDSNYESGRVGGKGSAGLGGLDGDLATAGTKTRAGMGKMAAGGAAIAGGAAAAGAGLAGRAKNTAGTGLSGIKDGVSGTVGGLKGNVQGGIDGARTNLQGGIDGARTSMQGGIDGVKGGIDGVKGNVQGGIDGVKGGIGDGISGLKGNVQGGIDGVKGNVQGGIDGVKGGIDGVRGNVQGGIDGVKGSIDGGVSGLKGNVQGGIDGVKGNMQAGSESATSGANSWLDRAKQRINEATDQVKDTASDIKDDITND